MPVATLPGADWPAGRFRAMGARYVPQQQANRPASARRRPGAATLRVPRHRETRSCAGANHCLPFIGRPFCPVRCSCVLSAACGGSREMLNGSLSLSAALPAGTAGTASGCGCCTMASRSARRGTGTASRPPGRRYRGSAGGLDQAGCSGAAAAGSPALGAGGTCEPGFAGARARWRPRILA